MPENRKGSEIGLYFLNRSQLVLLAAGFTATCVIAFLLGIVIGQGVEERKLKKQEEPLVKVPIQPASAKSGQAPAAKDDQLTFYDTLSKGAAAPAAKQPAPERNASVDVKPVVEVKPENKEKTEAKQKSAKTAEPAPAVKEKEKPAPEKVETASKTTEDDQAKSDAPRDWTVQVNAFPDERSAQRLAERLKQKGYDAYVVTANIKGRDWYRVRIGHFPARAQAKEYLEQLQAKEDFPKAIAVSK
jgi:cell division septation protein DedD